MFFYYISFTKFQVLSVTVQLIERGMARVYTTSLMILIEDKAREQKKQYQDYNKEYEL